LRELLPVLELDSDTTDKILRRLRKLTRRLGRVRELDVLLFLIDEVGESDRVPAGGLSLVRGPIHKKREEEKRDLSGKSVTGEIRGLSKKLRAVSEDLEAADARGVQRPAWRWAIDARVARRAGALKRAIDQAGAVYLAERLHTVRIALKKLRYGVELATEIGGAVDAGDLRTLKRAQELLGRMHDLQALIDRVRQVQGALSPPDVTIWRTLDSLVASLENNCRRLHARYVRERAALVALCDRFGARSAARRASARRVG
jgi:CHAD domain-containing protein